ncbi:MAG: nicotinate (nicotinamide) nucleotide adenylyltransferase [Spirochaetales bacterium]|nr:nicotinate (nicotinamide) nucleotide adenylyltransferase [Spirochaetales bacterium]
MRTAILGGTFNPVHWGHLLLAELAHLEAGYDRVLFIPTRKPAHKTIEGVRDEQRLEMLQLALEGFSVADLTIKIEACELYRPGVSDSIDTVLCVDENYVLEERAGLLLGDDLFESFDTWKDASELAQKVDLWVARRKFSDPLVSRFPHRYFNNPRFPVSSSEIRERVQKNQAWRALVPGPVARYIADHQLYRQGGLE